MSDKYQALRDALKTGWDSAFAISATPEVVTALLADLDAERLECMAQAKLNGIGAERELALMAERDALKADLDAAVAFIDDLRQDLHSRRIADWYPEGAHNAASAMSEDMRQLGNRCADFDAAGAAQPAQLPLLARCLSEWHEEDGVVVWWAWNGERRGWAGEAAYIGSPLCDDWPGYHTHWTPHPQQPTIATLSQIKAAGREQA